jgi:hypothetical protein
MAGRDLTVELYPVLQQHYVALLAQRDTGMSAVVQGLVQANSRLPYLKFLPLTLPLGMDNVEEFKQIIIDRLLTVTRTILADSDLTRRQMDALARHSARTADYRLREMLDILGQGAQTHHIVLILHALNKVATAPLKNLLLLLREYHDLLGVPGQAGYRLRFLVAGDEQLWRLCRHKEAQDISPFNIAQVVFIGDLSGPELIAANFASTSSEASEIVAFAGGVPALVETFQRHREEKRDMWDANLYFPLVQSNWNGLRPETQEALRSIVEGKSMLPSTIPDYQSLAIPDLQIPWSDAFWGGFLRFQDDGLKWRSAIHEEFIRHMAQQAATRRLESASPEERLIHLERASADNIPLDAIRSEAVSLARETGGDDFVDLLGALGRDEPSLDVQVRIKRITQSGRSAWLRTYGNMLAQADSGLEYMVVMGIILNAKRSLRRFDVFMCHNAQDKPSVIAVAEDLMKQGALPWLDAWEAPPGTLLQMILEGDIEQCKATAVFVGPSGIGPWQNMEIYTVLDDFTRRRRPIVPVILPGADQALDIPLFLRNYTWVDLRVSNANAAQKIIDVISQK